MGLNKMIVVHVDKVYVTCPPGWSEEVKMYVHALFITRW